MTDMDKVRRCPKCGKKMIKRYENRVLATYPPRYPWYWWCKCGHTEEGGFDIGLTIEDFYDKMWEVENKDSTLVRNYFCRQI